MLLEKRKHRQSKDFSMSSPTPHDFLEKWKLTPTQFGLLLGIKSAQVSRLLANPTATYGQSATSAQCDRLAELDLLLEIRSRSTERALMAGKIDRLIEGLEIFLKLIGVTASGEMGAIAQWITANDDINTSPAMARLNSIFTAKD